MGADVPLISLGEEYALDRWRPEDAAAHRRFALDPDAAWAFGWTVEEARRAPDAHYESVIRRFDCEWREGTRHSLAIRRCSDGEAVGSVELRASGVSGDVSYLVAAELRGHGLAPRALEAMLQWGADELGLREAALACHVSNAASRRVAEKCGFVLSGREGDELRFRRTLR